MTTGSPDVCTGQTLMKKVPVVLPRPLGASLGDGFAQSRSDGGLGVGITGTRLTFRVTIPAVSRRDQPPAPSDDAPRPGS